MNPFTRERGDLLWWDNQVPHSCSVRSRQKFFWIVMTQRVKIFYYNKMENELKGCHNKTNWENFVWMQDSWMLLKLDSASWRKTPQNSHNSQMQWPVVSTLFQEKNQHHNQEDGSRETPKLAPYWKLQPVICTLNMELRSELCLWAETTHTPGSEFLMDQTNLWWTWTTMNRNSRRSARRICVQTECKIFCMPIEGKSITTKKRTCWLFTENRSHWKKELDRYWTREIFFLRVWSIEESNLSSWSFTTSASRRRRSASFLENEGKSAESIATIDSLVWRTMEIMFGSRRRSKKEIPVLYWWFRNSCLFPSSSRTFRTQSFDPSLQDNVVIPSNFFQHIYHIGCAFNLHSIINSGLIPGGQNSSKRQTVFFLLVDPRDKSHKDPEKIYLNVPRHTQYLHNAWKRHQDAVYWVDINLAVKKGLTFYQTRSNAIILHETFPAYCIPKVVRMETGEVFYEKVYMSPRPPPKISLKHEWKREWGSDHAQRAEAGQLSGSFQSNQHF